MCYNAFRKTKPPPERKQGERFVGRAQSSPFSFTRPGAYRPRLFQELFKDSHKDTEKSSGKDHKGGHPVVLFFAFYLNHPHSAG